MWEQPGELCLHLDQTSTSLSSNLLTSSVCAQPVLLGGGRGSKLHRRTSNAEQDYRAAAGKSAYRCWPGGFKRKDATRSKYDEQPNSTTLIQLDWRATSCVADLRRLEQDYSVHAGSATMRPLSCEALAA